MAPGIACESIRFSFALRRWGRFATSPAAQSEGETDAFAGYTWHYYDGLWERHNKGQGL